MSTLQLAKISAAPWGQPLLHGISTNLDPGKILAIAGPNGAGKSSLLKLLAGDITPASGSLTFNDKPLAQWPAQTRAQQLAVLPQLSLLNFPYTVEEVVLLGRIPHSTGRQVDIEVVQQALAMTDMQALRQRLYTQLSGGEKQRAQLARVFAQVCHGEDLTGSLLLLDEPTSALDLAHQQQVLNAIRQLARRGCAVVMVIHDMNLVAGIADEILVLESGRQAALGPPGEVLTQSLFRQVFGVEVSIGLHPQDNTPMIMPHLPPP
ncbi:MAG: iron complex transport system ATP-binding protein [Bacteroidia bacterium]|jgi:iron complex transport system ATP-binding protein